MGIASCQSIYAIHLPLAIRSVYSHRWLRAAWVRFIIQTWMPPNPTNIRVKIKSRLGNIGMVIYSIILCFITSTILRKPERKSKVSIRLNKQILRETERIRLKIVITRWSSWILGYFKFSTRMWHKLDLSVKFLSEKMRHRLCPGTYRAPHGWTLTWAKRSSPRKGFRDFMETPVKNRLLPRGSIPSQTFAKVTPTESSPTPVTMPQ